MTEIYIFAGVYTILHIISNWWWFKMVIGPDHKKEDKKDEV